MDGKHRAVVEISDKNKSDYSIFITFRYTAEKKNHGSRRRE